MAYDFRVLGPLEVLYDGRPLTVTGGRQRAVLALLLLARGNAVPSDRLAEQLWNGEPPAGARAALQTYVSTLRRALRPNGSPTSDGPVLTVVGGYRVATGADSLDVQRFERLAREGHASLFAGEPREADEQLSGALALWRGPALADFLYEPFAQHEIRRLEDLRIDCLENRIEARLAAGAHPDLVAELEPLVRAHPLRERLRGQLMRALYRVGRQADALAAYQNARKALDAELGLEPSAELRELERAILRQDPALLVATRSAPAGGSPAAADTTRTPALITVRRPVSVACADLELLSLGEGDSDPEVVARALRDSTRRLEEILTGAGATTQTHSGGRVVAAFGLDVTREDDAVRAARAALAARETFERDQATSVACVLRIGVASGSAALDRCGSIEQAAALAARASDLARRAGPGEVLLDARTRTLVQGVMELGPSTGGPGSVLAGERSDPVADVYPPMVGRRAELARLQALAAACVESCEPCLVTIAGPPGIGKTRLATELIAALPTQASYVHASCTAHGESDAFGPLRALIAAPGDSGSDLRTLLSAHPDGARAAEVIASVLGSEGITTSADDVVWAGRCLFEALARRGPVVFVLEDAHWASDLLLDTIEHAIARASDAPLLVVATARPELLEQRPLWAGGRPQVETLFLDPLGDDDAERLIDTTSAVLTASERGAVLDRAGGIPLFLEQLAAFVVERGAQGAHALPATIESLLAARLELLTDTERATIEAASVVGQEFWSGAVDAGLAATTSDSATPALAALGLRGLVHGQADGLDQQDYRFGHALVREAAYVGVPLTRRATMHEAVANWLEQALGDRLPQLHELVGYHLERAWHARTALAREPGADRETARRAGRHLSQAADRALAVSNFTAGAELLERAAVLYRGDDPEWTRTRIALGRALVDCARFDDAQAVLDEAVTSASRDTQLVALALLEQHGLDAYARPERFVDGTTDLLERIRPRRSGAGDPAETRWLRLAGLHAWMRCQSAEAGRYFEEALDNALRSGVSRMASELCGWLASVALYGPEPLDVAATRCEEMLTSTAGSPVSSAWVLKPLAAIQALQGNSQLSRELLARGNAALSEAPPGHEATLSDYDAIVLVALGELGQAETLLVEAESALAAAGERSLRAGVALRLADLFITQGRHAEAAQARDRAAALAAASDIVACVETRRLGAELAVCDGSPQRAIDLAAEAISLADDTDQTWLRAGARLTAARCARAAGRNHAATREFSEAKALFETKGDATGLARIEDDLNAVESYNCEDQRKRRERG